MSINGHGHSLTLVKGHSDFKVKRLTFGLYTQVSNSGPLGPLVRGGSFRPLFFNIQQITVLIFISFFCKLFMTESVQNIQKKYSWIIHNVTR